MIDVVENGDMTTFGRPVKGATKSPGTVSHNGCDALDAEARGLAASIDPDRSTGTAFLVGCTFTAQRETETRRMIESLVREGYDRVVVTGCAARLAGIEDPKVVQAPMDEVLRRYGRSAPGPQRTGKGPLIPISEGCFGKCSFCSIRVARGRTRSRPIAEIVTAIRQAAATYGRVRLVGQEVAGYGLDAGTSLWSLLDAVFSETQGVSIELGSLNPKWLVAASPAQLAMLGSERIVGNLHVAVQSMSDDVLSAMRREYSAAESASLLATLRDLRQGAISADMLVAFPGESEADHHRSLDFIRDYPLSFCQIFMFEKRQGTPAAHMEDLPPEVKLRRTCEMVAAFLCKNGHLGRKFSAGSSLPFNTNVSLLGSEASQSAKGHLGTALGAMSGISSAQVASFVEHIASIQRIRAISESPVPEDIYTLD